MKSLRRSLNAKDQSGSPPLSSISSPVAFPPLHKPPSAILPPKKVIRALQPYRPQAPQELGFSKGDFFYVVSEVAGGQGWYEAHNPVSGARGLVPKACFEEFHKANAVARAVSPVAAPAAAVSPARSAFTPSHVHSRHQSFYAIVLHDFTAERTDELGAKSGDPITVVAQSNEEWFVAKPIGKLGRPGLIPASFVELRDPATNLPLPDVAGIMARGELPKVEDWKRAMQEYKQSSISLGVLDDRSTAQGAPTAPRTPLPPPLPSASSGLQTPPIVPTRDPASLESPPGNRPPTPVSMKDPNLLPPGLLMTAEVVDYHFENDEYWFRINAIYQPEDVSTSSMPLARQLVLFRVYDDFYDFQIALLDTFPVEAGRENGPPSPQSEGGPTVTEPSRILPYMPGPVPQVDHVVTSLRREELDEYLGQLCALKEINAEHVLRHPLVRSFFSPKPGDVETEIPPIPFTQTTGVEEYQSDHRLQQYEEARNGIGALSLGPGKSTANSDPRYDEDRGQSRGSDQGYHTTERVPSRNGLNNYSRTDSSASLSLSQNMSPQSNHSPLDGAHQSYRHTDSGPASDDGPSASSSRQIYNPHSSPTISATNSQTAFVKIKIFHRRTDDLIAIRVNPRVSHMQLMEKVRERLGDDVQGVSFRNSITGAFADLHDDYALRDWLDHADKLVLYAL